MNNQDKAKWCERGQEDEQAFLAIAADYRLYLVEHPNKAGDIYETDYQLANGLMDVDLKHVTTPFFKAGNYGYDPDYTVTFNHKDYIRYRYKYPEWGNDMAILFWVEWDAQTRFDVNVADITGVWSLRLGHFDEMVRRGKLSCHSYLHRTGESGTNAKHSWLVDLRGCTQHEKIL